MLKHSLKLPCLDNNVVERLVDKINIRIMTLDGLNNWNEIGKARGNDTHNNNLRVGNGLIIQSISNQVSRRLSNSTVKGTTNPDDDSNDTGVFVCGGWQY